MANLDGPLGVDRRSWSRIHCSDGEHPYAGNWWVSGLCLDYEHSFIHELAEFYKSLDDPTAEKRYPDFRNALGTQYVCGRRRERRMIWAV